MPNPSKRKGQNLEYQVRDFFLKNGSPSITATQRPQSSGVPGDVLKCDCAQRNQLLIDLRDDNHTEWIRKHMAECPNMKVIECKWAKEGWRRLYRWLGHSNMLALKADRKDILVVLRLRDYVE